jgi:hypothetical protein
LDLRDRAWALSAGGQHVPPDEVGAESRRRSE